MKKHLYLLGWLYALTCGLALALGLTLCVALWADPSPKSQTALQFIAPPFLFGACVVLVPGLIGGIGLLYFRPWARPLLLIPSVLLLFLAPFGTVLGAYGLWILRNRTFTALLAGGASAAPDSRPGIPPLSSPLPALLGIMACVGSGFFMVIKLGFITHGEPVPAPFDSTALTAGASVVLVAVFGLMTVAGIRSVGTAVSGARIRREANRSAAEYREARRLRVAELAADPARAKYAPLVERGEDWTEENIAYYEDVESTVTCSHLQPIERAMRQRGINLRRRQKSQVIAQCQIDDAALEQAFSAGPPVRYAAFYQSERAEHDHPTAFLICDEDLSMIHVLHPDEPDAQRVPVFPV